MEKYNFCNNTNPTNLTNEESKELTVLIEIPDTKKTHKQKVKENELKFILAGVSRKYAKDMAIWERIYKSYIKIEKIIK